MLILDSNSKPEYNRKIGMTFAIYLGGDMVSGKFLIKAKVTAGLLILSGCVTSSQQTENTDSFHSDVVSSKKENTAGLEYKECIKAEGSSGPLTQRSFEKCEYLLPSSECKGKSCMELGKIEFSAAMTTFISKIRACYDKEMSANKNAKGKIETGFSVNKEGRVENLVLKNNELSASMGNCLASTSKEWIFPRKSGRTESITYPFIFNPD
jgi:hypothetical protein